MSRALDKDVLASITKDQSSAAYQAISKALSQSDNEEQLLEIEFLGKSHPLQPGTFLLQDGNALGISKLGLALAFFGARPIFLGHKPDGLSSDRLLAVTNVILLMDAENLTAANARKRLTRSVGADSTAQLLELVQKDKFYIDSLLTSRLHRHTKSPTLWSHRRWLVETARQHGVHPNVTEDLKHIVMVSGQRHPKNYYAWCHARWLTGLIPKDEQDQVIPRLVTATKDWCFRNHTDISGWSFLSFLLIKLNDSSKSLVFEETVKLAASFQWINESTWVFLRTLAASGGIGDKEMDLFHETREALYKRTQSPEERRVIEQARSWWETYRQRA